VAAGILVDAAGQILIAQRPPGSHAAGFWEFPGGKFQPDESAHHALCRELAEELGIRVLDARPFMQLRHEYPERSVELHFFRVTVYAGEPAGREGQALRWVRPCDLDSAGLLPADQEVVARLLEKSAVSRS
jgi:8-oxo-dGTP diphosphatase